MPYVKPEKRERIEAGGGVRNSGELNYVFTMMAERYRQEHGDSYETYNDIVGALDNAKDEFRRRVLHPYEDRKRAEHGEVYRDAEV